MFESFSMKKKNEDWVFSWPSPTQDKDSRTRLLKTDEFSKIYIS